MSDITWLLIAVIVGLVQIMLAAQMAQKYRSLDWNVGPRDTSIPVEGTAGRLERAYRNFLETFPLFAAALIAVVIQHKSGGTSHWGALLYVIARIVYVPLYALGVKYVRTAVWAVSIVGIVMLIVAAF
ncbi:MAG TPA: MAPEG family protein [Stellaceae bacterium]